MCKGWKDDYACGHIDSHFTSFCPEKCSMPKNGPTTYLDTACQKCDPKPPRKSEERRVELMARFFGPDCVRETPDIDGTESVQSSAPPSPISASFIGCTRTCNQRRRDSYSDSDDGGRERSYIADDGKVIQTEYTLINGHNALITHRRDPKDVDPQLLAKLQAKRQKNLAKLEATERRRRLKEQEAKERFNRDQNVKREVRRGSRSEGSKKVHFTMSREDYAVCRGTDNLTQAENAMREIRITPKTEHAQGTRSTSDTRNMKQHGVKDNPSHTPGDKRPTKPHRRNEETRTVEDYRNEGMKLVQVLLEKKRKEIAEAEKEKRKELEEAKKKKLEEAEIINEIVKRSSQVVKEKKKAAKSFSERLDKTARLRETPAVERGEDHESAIAPEPELCHCQSVRRRPKHDSLRDLFR
ncbi:hypothetical protein GGR57DRAFT_520860 [Xylariaceae sp. FL1272]|nr:hypothetical protein GGR57DRAFT_520860 [Xylariaceae sp. FL1272]